MASWAGMKTSERRAVTGIAKCEDRVGAEGQLPCGNTSLSPCVTFRVTFWNQS